MKLLYGAIGLLSLFTLTACNKPTQPPQPTLHEVMAGVIYPLAYVTWEESNKAYGDDGKAAQGKLTPIGLLLV